MYNSPTAEQIAIIEKRIKEGAHYTTIAKELGFCVTTIKKYSSPEMNRKMTDMYTERIKKYNAKPEVKAMKRVYMREYIHRRYHEEPAFRERFLAAVRRSAKKRRDEKRERKINSAPRKEI
jgi:hypothetical protein